MPRRHYSDEERAAALAALKANGGDVDRTASQVGVPRTTLQHWRDDPRRATSPKLRQEKEEQLSELLSRVARESINAMSGKVTDADYKDLAVGSGILIDKLRLMQGKPTNITESRNLDLSRLSDDELAELERLTDRASVES